MINTRKKDGLKSITVRLQGVDAPELHYKASALRKSNEVTDEKRAAYNKLNIERRQFFAESATVALAKHLKKFAKEGLVEAVFESEVESPFEVVDTYGRFIGNIFVGKNMDLNLWLVANGWCSPAFYTSMSAAEINDFLKAWEKGKKKKNRTSTSLSFDSNLFDDTLIFREPESVRTFKVGEDKGNTLMPKIFRRQVGWQVAKKAKVITASFSFKNYLKKSPDQVVLLDEFLNNGLTAATIQTLDDFITPEGIILKTPEQLVFQEKPGTLVNTNGVKVINW